MTMVNQSAFSGAEWTEDVEVIEPAVNLPVFYTGIRAVAVNGVAHLMLYVEQPSSCGGTELTVTCRLVTPLSRAKAVLEAAGSRLSQIASQDQSRRMREADGQIKH